MWLHIGGCLGDVVAATGFIREYKRAYPAELIKLAEGTNWPTIFTNNPHIGVGTEDKRPTVTISPVTIMERGVGNIVYSYAAHAGVPVADNTPEIHLLPKEIAAGHKLIPYHPAIAVDPWTRWPSRRWPLDRYARVITGIRKAGWCTVEVGAPVNNHVGENNRDCPRLPVELQLFGKLDIRGTAAVLAACDLYLGNDSGCFHLAAAVGTPQVVFFGPKLWHNPAYWHTTPLHDTRPCDGGCRELCAAKQHCLGNVTVKQCAAAINIACERYLLGSRIRGLGWTA